MGNERGTDVAGWDGLEFGEAVGERLRHVRREGLSMNRAAPDGILVGLIDVSDQLPYRPDLPQAVLEAVIDHPDRKVRGHFAEHRGATLRFSRTGTRPCARLTADQWSRLVLAEPDSRRRYWLAVTALEDTARLTEEAYEALASAGADAAREEAASLPGLPERLLRALARDPAPTVRAAVCGAAWAELDDEVRARLAADRAEAVRTAVALARHEEVPVTAELFDALADRYGLVETRRLERDLAARLCAEGAPSVRRSLAENPYLDPFLVSVLAVDPDAGVRLAVSVRPGLTEEQRADLLEGLELDGVRRPVPWVEALHEDPEAMRRLSTSVHPVLRGSVATARRLPTDVVERLARDEDRVVRLFLAERCDDAPADMLLEVWNWWTGSLSTPNRPYGHPNFPRRDLLRHAEDPHRRLRQLALDDPDSTAALVERFSRDEDEEVRARAATDPRLSARSAARLLDDPDPHVRGLAAQHPRLPVPDLVRLLGDEETARAAARNPALPEWAMWRMLD
ncbi:PE-PGRS family protein [Streptomyces sp. ISL-66]|uniref:PE-PGRS family protein n=1 Tax=Streptomyces sp. ISL-66 TaxID=2819186 RepID=UPI001BE54AD0|nr:PE-PGRS family protein [Streptomyces sp. ISL-66]MBT2468294.1 PE-PGRS family protein [Streptomyces sp. ISL-66]